MVITKRARENTGRKKWLQNNAVQKNVLNMFVVCIITVLQTATCMYEQRITKTRLF